MCGGLTSMAQKGDFYAIKNIEVVGNERTKTAIILRELTVQVGDTVASDTYSNAREQSRNNLRNTGLFNSLKIFETLTPAGAGVSVTWKVEVVERWYLWPIPLFENAETNFNSWWQNRDFGRLEYGVYITQHNLRGRNDRLRIVLRQGFTEEYGIQYRPAWIDRQQTFGMTAAVSYKRNKELNTHSIDNKRLFHEAADFQRREIVASLAIHQRAKFRNTHTYLAEYRNVQLADTIDDIQADYLNPAQKQPEGTDVRERFITLGYHFKRDNRDVQYYPLSGYMVEADIKKIGLNPLALHHVNVLDVSAAWHHHAKIGDRLFAAFGLTGKTTVLDPPPYYLQQGLGYGSKMIRGYEVYVMDGQHYGLMRTTFKVRPWKSTHRYIRATMLKQEIRHNFRLDTYFTAFFDGGYVVDNLYADQNPLSNSWQHGMGVGIDFVTIYDLVLRTELSRNKLGETGFFLHFMKAI